MILRESDDADLPWENHYLKQLMLEEIKRVLQTNFLKKSLLSLIDPSLEE